MARASTIAIDGPVAVGKSTVGRLLAQRLGYRFLDTGIMYRAVTWLALRRKMNLEDEETLAKLASQVKIELPRQATEEASRVRIDGCDPGPELRSPKVETNVSQVSRLGGVRQALVAQQQALAREGNLVVAGRDIGTVVLPQADLKVFLTASTEVRAQRRYRELLGLGQKADYQTILSDLRRRDQIDSERTLSPLKPAADARIVNTDNLTLEQVLDLLYKLSEPS